MYEGLHSYGVWRVTCLFGFTLALLRSMIQAAFEAIRANRAELLKCFNSVHQYYRANNKVIILHRLASYNHVWFAPVGEDVLLLMRCVHCRDCVPVSRRSVFAMRTKYRLRDAHLHILRTFVHILLSRDRILFEARLLRPLCSTSPSI